MKKLKIRSASELMITMGLVLVVVGILMMYRFINKDSLIGVINRNLPPQEAGLLAGVLFGEKTGFEKGFWKDLTDSGVVHLVVVSGTNVVLLSGVLVENLAWLLGRKKTIVMVLILVWGYAGMVGWEPPIIRAVLLVSIYYWAQLLGRKFDIWRSLVLVVLIMLLVDRTMVVGVSFWLSFLAFVAVVTQKNKGLFKDLITTVWVSLWITPIMALVFGRISVISPLSNLLVIFLVEMITMVGGIGVFLGLIWPILGKMVLLLIFPILRYFVLVVEFLGGWRWASIEVKFNWLMLAGWYMILGWFLTRRNKGV